MPKISVIVPVYNAEKYLEQCIESILNQTYSDIELLLIDDGSTDNSRRICDFYKNKDKRVRVVHKKNGGSASSRKVGVENASGEYVAFIDADDWIDVDTFKECIQLAEKSATDCVLFSYVREYPNASIPVNVFWGNQINFEDISNAVYLQLFGLTGELLARPERGDSIVPCWGKLYSASIVKKGKFYDTNEVGTCEDALFNIHALRGCKRICYIDQPFYHYRKTDFSSLSSAYKPRLFEQWKKLFGYMQDAIVEYELGEEYREALSNRIALQIIGLGFVELDNPQKCMRVKNIRRYLNDPEYVKACSALETRYMPFLWKVFFTLCKIRCAYGVFLGLKISNELKGRV